MRKTKRKKKTTTKKEEKKKRGQNKRKHYCYYSQQHQNKVKQKKSWKQSFLSTNTKSASIFGYDFMAIRAHKKRNVKPHIADTNEPEKVGKA